ncbi:MAG: dephospho-CoA kinase [Deltaproteobacteria bacterium]|nr:dephospho-CoA kinase [Deltaproteobacteria bacterium]
MKVIGLTGGIASGKSLVARLLSDLGAHVIDADVLARKVVEPCQPAYHDIVRELGRDVLAQDGTIDRKKLGAMVFADEAKRSRLNAITHPRIAALARKEMDRLALEGEQVVIYEAALIVENGLHAAMDGLIVVSAPPEVQLERVMRRDGLDEESARARLAAQLPLEEKLEVATHVIDNSGALEDTRAQVSRTWESLKDHEPKSQADD